MNAIRIKELCTKKQLVLGLRFLYCKIRYIVHLEWILLDIYIVAKHLLEDGYIEFKSHQFDSYDLIKDCTEVEAKLDVVKPWN